MLGTGGGPAPWQDADPFDLPDWLGTREVTWTSSSALRASALVAGELSAADEEPVGCDLLAVDEAYPVPVADDDLRTAAHQAWRRGDVHLGSRGGRLTLAVPGSGIDADRTLDAVARLAKSVGASPSSYAVCLRLGQDGRRADR